MSSRVDYRAAGYPSGGGLGGGLAYDAFRALRPDTIPAGGGGMLAYEPPQAASVALAHDYLLVMRGAERTFAAIADLYPAGADPHSALRQAGHDAAGSRDDRSSPLRCSDSGSRQSSLRRLLPLYPRGRATPAP